MNGWLTSYNKLWYLSILQKILQCIVYIVLFNKRKKIEKEFRYYQIIVSPTYYMHGCHIFLSVFPKKSISVIMWNLVGFFFQFQIKGRPAALGSLI